MQPVAWKIDAIHALIKALAQFQACWIVQEWLGVGTVGKVGKVQGCLRFRVSGTLEYSARWNKNSWGDCKCWKHPCLLVSMSQPNKQDCIKTLSDSENDSNQPKELFKSAGSFTLVSGWLKEAPKLNNWREFGNLTLSRPWSKSLEAAEQEMAMPHMLSPKCTILTSGLTHNRIAKTPSPRTMTASPERTHLPSSD